MDAFWLAASPLASRPRFKKSAQFARIRHRHGGPLQISLNRRSSGSDTTVMTTTTAEEEPTNDLASFPPILGRGRAACGRRLVVSGGRAWDQPGAREVTFLPVVKERVAVRCRALCLPTCTCQPGKKRANARVRKMRNRVEETRERL